jgi:acetyl esterase/lipase
VTIAIALAVSAAGAAAPSVASSPRSLASEPPGTVLSSRAISLSLGTFPTPVTATQLTYRTTDQLGHPEADVTTVIAPSPLSGVIPRIVTYLSFYDDLGGKCAPSYTLAGGDSGASNESEAEEEELLMAVYVANGWIVTVPDYEGPHLDWMAGREEGRSTLDAIRATESALGLGTTTQVALSGYSGGAVAADWASELASSYAPDLDLAAVAEGGIPVDYAHLFSYVSGDKVYGAAMPGMLLGLARAYHFPLRKYLSSYGKHVVHAESTTCIGSDFGHYPGLTYQRLFKSRYRNPLLIPAIARMFNDQLMGREPGSPLAPLMMGIGDIDGFGDGVMRDGDVESLAREYCGQGTSVEFHRYGGAGHEAAGAYFEPESAVFFQGRFNGLPFAGNCGSIPQGDPLAPLPVQR